MAHPWLADASSTKQIFQGSTVSNKAHEISGVCHIGFCPTFFVGALRFFLGESFIGDALNDCLCYSGQTNKEVGRICIF